MELRFPMLPSIPYNKCPISVCSLKPSQRKYNKLKITFSQTLDSIGSTVELNFGMN